MRFHHVGVITRELDAAIRLYETFGYALTRRVNDHVQLAEIVLLERDDGPMVELVSPSDRRSPAMQWIKKLEAGAYHTCYEVDDLKAAAATLADHGVRTVMEPVAAVAFDGRPVTFLWGRNVGLIELLQSR